ncbi:hypothetical protein ACRAWD_04840 [Caulobacter segnis]
MPVGTLRPPSPTSRRPSRLPSPRPSRSRPPSRKPRRSSRLPPRPPRRPAPAETAPKPADPPVPKSIEDLY